MMMMMTTLMMLMTISDWGLGTRDDHYGREKVLGPTPTGRTHKP